MLPTPEVFAREMGRLGLRDGMTLVVYEQAGPFSAPRAWWMLRTFGVRDVYVLDGGLRAWVEAGLPTESGEGQRPEATFHATLDSSLGDGSRAAVRSRTHGRRGALPAPHRSRGPVCAPVTCRVPVAFP